MLSRVEETNEPTLRSQLSPEEPESGHHPAHGGFLGHWGPHGRGLVLSPPGGTCPAACCCCHLLARAVVAGLNVIPVALGPLANLSFSQALKPGSERHRWYLRATLPTMIPGAMGQPCPAPAVLPRYRNHPHLLPPPSAWADPNPRSSHTLITPCSRLCSPGDELSTSGPGRRNPPGVSPHFPIHPQLQGAERGRGWPRGEGLLSHFPYTAVYRRARPPVPLSQALSVWGFFLSLLKLRAPLQPPPQGSAGAGSGERHSRTGEDGPRESEMCHPGRASGEVERAGSDPPVFSHRRGCLW